MTDMMQALQGTSIPQLNDLVEMVVQTIKIGLKARLQQKEK